MIKLISDLFNRVMAFLCLLIIVVVSLCSDLLILPYWIITGHRVHWVYWINGFMYFLVEEAFGEK